MVDSEHAVCRIAGGGAGLQVMARDVEPLGPVEAATAPVTPGEARPTAFVAPVAVVGAEDARGVRRALRR